MKKKIISFICCTMASILLLLSINVSIYAADSKTNININGVRLVTDVDPIIKDGRTFVPVRAIGEALGFTFDYDSNTQTVTMSHSGKNFTIKMSINKNEAYVNNILTALQAAPFIQDGRTMIPLRFISESLESRVDWIPGYDSDSDWDFDSKNNTIDIWCAQPIMLKSRNAAISSRMYTYEWTLPEDHSITYDITLPNFSGMKNTVFQQQLNAMFDTDRQAAIQGMKEAYDELQFETGYIYDASHDYSYDLIGETKNITSILVTEYIYLGGAHGSPQWTGFNIDFGRSKVLTLQDLFNPNSNYSKFLIDTMNRIRLGTRTHEYEDVEEVSELPGDTSFYIKGGNLVLYYHPYELSSYARGFVEFRIPLTSLQSFLSDNYKTLAQ